MKTILFFFSLLTSYFAVHFYVITILDSISLKYEKYDFTEAFIWSVISILLWAVFYLIKNQSL